MQADIVVRQMAQIDPRLKQRIRSAKDSEEDVKAVITLKNLANKDSAKDNAANQQKTVDEILENIQKKTHRKPKKVKFLPKLSALIIEGDANTVEQLTEQPQVSSATVSDEEDFVKGESG